MRFNVFIPRLQFHRHKCNKNKLIPNATLKKIANFILFKKENYLNLHLSCFKINQLICDETVHENKMVLWIQFAQNKNVFAILNQVNYTNFNTYFFNNIAI